MKKLFLIIFFLFSFTVGVLAAPQDSIGLKNENGKTYILHKVEKGETLYGLARKYNTQADKIMEANPTTKSGLKLGEVIMIPAAHVQGNTTTASSSGKVYHVVQKGETLSFIARAYGTSVAEIKRLNNLTSDNVQLGQKLLVADGTTNVVKPTVKNTFETIKDTVSKPTIVVVETNNTNKVVPVDNTYVDRQDDGTEITETGKVVVSNENSLNPDRNYVLHPSAKIGTIIMITNPENNKSVFARVVGNYVLTSGAPVLKMSNAVAQKLGATSSEFTAKISYAK